MSDTQQRADIYCMGKGRCQLLQVMQQDPSRADLGRGRLGLSEANGTEIVLQGHAFLAQHAIEMTDPAPAATAADHRAICKI